jgi:hypothetical protein
MLIKLPSARYRPSVSLPSFQTRLSLFRSGHVSVNENRDCLYCFKEEAYLEDHKSEMEKSYYPSIIAVVGRIGI